MKDNAFSNNHENKHIIMEDISFLTLTVLDGGRNEGKSTTAFRSHKEVEAAYGGHKKITQYFQSKASDQSLGDDY